MKRTKFAISSYQASIFSLSCLPAILMKREFERMRWKLPLLGRMDKQFNSLIVLMARSNLNPKLMGERLFDAVELHLTDPRIFYNPLEWKVNERMVGRVKAPISSFHAHMELDPLLKRYVFNMSDNSQKTRKAIRNQLHVAYKILNKHPELITTENPVFVFHAGAANSEDDRENALARTRENIEYIAITNYELWVQYGKDRKILPTIENSPIDNHLSLGQTIEEWQRLVQGFEDQVKLTLDYGHVVTIKGQREKLFEELRHGSIGSQIVNLHLHYSPEIDNEIRHVHAALSSIPRGKVEGFQNDIRRIVAASQIRNQGYVTLEVPSKDPFDYMPALRPVFTPLSHIHRLRALLESTGIFDFSPYRGTCADQLESLRMAREMIESYPELELPETAEVKVPILVG